LQVDTIAHGHHEFLHPVIALCLRDGGGEAQREEDCEQKRAMEEAFGHEG
jgi:hypothetical protein